MPSSILLSDNGVTSGTQGLKHSGGDDGVLLIQTTTSGGTPTTAIEISNTQRSKFPTTIGVGNATPSTSGSGISFPATQSASTDANTLDDYEEGNFTPVLNFGGGTSGITYNVQVGRYTKVGRLVTYSFVIRLTSKGSSSGDANISLPFSSDEYAQPNLPGYTSYIACFRANTGLIVGNAGASGKFFDTTTAGAILTNSDFTNSTAIAMTISYNVS